MSSGGSGQGVPPRRRLRNKIVITMAFFLEALARGHPGGDSRKDGYYQEMPSGGSGQGSPQEETPEQDGWFQERPSGGSGQASSQEEAPEQDCYYQGLLSGGSGQETDPSAGGSRTRLLLLVPRNAFWKPWPGVTPRRRLKNTIVITKKCLLEALARGPPQEEAPEQDGYYQEMPSGRSPKGNHC